MALRLGHSPDRTACRWPYCRDRRPGHYKTLEIAARTGRPGPWVIRSEAMKQAWPPIPYPEWRDTCAALHLWSQVIGKYRPGAYAVD